MAIEIASWTTKYINNKKISFNVPLQQLPRATRWKRVAAIKPLSVSSWPQMLFIAGSLFCNKKILLLFSSKLHTLPKGSDYRWMLQSVVPSSSTHRATSVLVESCVPGRRMNVPKSNMLGSPPALEGNIWLFHSLSAPLCLAVCLYFTPCAVWCLAGRLQWL